MKVQRKKQEGKKQKVDSTLEKNLLVMRETKNLILQKKKKILKKYKSND